MKFVRMIGRVLVLTTVTLSWDCFPLAVSTGVDIGRLAKKTKFKEFHHPSHNVTQVSWSKKNCPAFGMLINVNLPFGIGPYLGLGLRVDFLRSHSSPDFSKLTNSELKQNFFTSSGLKGVYTREQLDKLTSFLANNEHMRYKRVLEALLRCGCQFLSFYVEVAAGISRLKTKLTHATPTAPSLTFAGDPLLADAYETFATKNILHFKKTGITYNVEIGYKIGTFYSVAVSGGYLPMIKAYRVGLGVRVGL